MDDRRDASFELEAIDPGDVPAGNWVALGYNLKIVAFDPSRQRAKEKAIIKGVDSPLVVRIEQIRR